MIREPGQVLHDVSAWFFWERCTITLHLFESLAVDFCYSVVFFLQGLETGIQRYCDLQFIVAQLIGSIRGAIL